VICVPYKRIARAATGEYLRRKRIEGGLLQRELGERLGVPQETISKLETGTLPIDCYAGQIAEQLPGFSERDALLAGLRAAASAVEAA
jgi:transcriptional regulator with XRE-family HTH domain